MILTMSANAAMVFGQILAEERGLVATNNCRTVEGRAVQCCTMPDITDRIGHLRCEAVSNMRTVGKHQKPRGSSQQGQHESAGELKNNERRQ